MADETLTKADIDAAVEKATSALKESIDKLTTKNEELIGENRKLKRGADIKPEDVAALETEIDKLKGELTTAQKAAKDATAAKEKAEKSLETETGFTQKLVAENGLRDLLLKGGVTDPDYLDLAVAKHLPLVKVVAEGDTRKGMVGEKDLAAYVTEVLSSDAGKKIVAAAVNSGGGAPGGTKGEPGKTMTRTAYDALAPAQQHAFVTTEGGTVVDQAA